MRKINNTTPVIVVGGNHHNTLGVLRSLGQKGIKSYVVLHELAPEKCFVLKSKYVKEGFAEKNGDAVIQRIYTIIENIGNEKPVVICTSDIASSLVDSHHDRLANFCYLPGSIEQGRITSLMDKTKQINLAQEAGLLVPHTWMVNQLDDIRKVTFPCIVKPQASIHGSKSDIAILKNEESLVSYLNKSTQESVLVQNYIEREFEFQLIGCSLDAGSEVIIPGYTRIIRSSERTNTGVLRYQPIDFDVDLKKCQKLMQATGYSGLFSMEFLRAKDNKNYFLEINFRNDGNSICVTASGINLPYIWYLSQIGENTQFERLKIIRPVTVIPVFDDYFHFVRTGKMSKLKWMCDLLRADCLMDVQFTDLKPLFNRIFKL